MTRSHRRARVIARPKLNEFKEKYPEAADALDNWEDTVTSLSFSTFQELHAQINTVDLVNGVHLVFNIMGNRYRLITGVYWGHPAIYLKEFFTHKEYDQWSAEQRTDRAKKAAKGTKKGGK
ncbi:type II toxin-antitoxin system HigB family toxin [Deinococcus cavernae]|uniref:Type II toxin-antitoxin system HigB family toxin n=1 Tax=Deinococcus cavernae TaxID=2320857 RepID=A0A418VEC8_9DEIO|nr:type II toxin-antitoxin system HigB family toxin [Deinococcus cavernae]RJF74466.1 type II toxin-antitoxin system HigB family toxin [Deinococcus cavernae]